MRNHVLVAMSAVAVLVLAQGCRPQSGTQRSSTESCLEILTLRDQVEISVDEYIKRASSLSRTEYDKLHKDAGGGIGIGPVKLGGSYEEYKEKLRLYAEANSAESARKATIKTTTCSSVLLAAYQSCLETAAAMEDRKVLSIRIIEQPGNQKGVVVDYLPPPTVEGDSPSKFNAGFVVADSTGRKSFVREVKLGSTEHQIDVSADSDVYVSVAAGGYRASAEWKRPPKWASGTWKGTLVRPIETRPQPEIWPIYLRADGAWTKGGIVKVDFDTAESQQLYPDKKCAQEFVVESMSDGEAKLVKKSGSDVLYRITVKRSGDGAALLFYGDGGNKSESGTNWVELRR